MKFNAKQQIKKILRDNRLTRFGADYRSALDYELLNMSIVRTDGRVEDAYVRYDLPDPPASAIADLTPVMTAVMTAVIQTVQKNFPEFRKTELGDGVKLRICVRVGLFPVESVSCRLLEIDPRSSRKKGSSSDGHIQSLTPDSHTGGIHKYPAILPFFSPKKFTSIGGLCQLLDHRFIGHNDSPLPDRRYPRSKLMASFVALTTVCACSAIFAM